MAARRRLKRFLHTGYQLLREFIFGAALSWVTVPIRLKRRNQTEQIFVINLVMEMHGVPLLPTPYRLLMLPYLVPHLMTWRRRLRLWDDSLETVDLRHIGH